MRTSIFPDPFNRSGPVRSGGAWLRQIDEPDEAKTVSCSAGLVAPEDRRTRPEGMIGNGRPGQCRKGSILEPAGGFLFPGRPACAIPEQVSTRLMMIIGVTVGPP